MGKSRGLRRVSFSSSGAIRTTCLFALKRWVETTRWESNIGIEHLQRTKHAWPTEEEEEEDEDGDEVEDVYDGDRIARVLKLGIERHIEAINFNFFSTLCISIVVTPLPLGSSSVPLPQHKPSVGKNKSRTEPPRHSQFISGQPARATQILILFFFFGLFSIWPNINRPQVQVRDKV